MLATAVYLAAPPSAAALAAAALASRRSDPAIRGRMMVRWRSKASRVSMAAVQVPSAAAAAPLAGGVEVLSPSTLRIGRPWLLVAPRLARVTAVVPLRYRFESSKVWTLLRYLERASTELWRIIEEGYSPQDPMNLTRREVVDHQLNAIAIDMIHLAITPKDRAHIHSLKTAKEAWDELDKLFLGNGSIQYSRFSEVMANDFVMVEGESPEEMYRLLIALAMQMQDLGATFVDDLWIKKKFYNALLPWSGNKKRNSRPRNSCYNCGDKSHFVADCIYERRDLNGGYLIRKSKFRSLPKGLSKLSLNNDVTKISSTEKPRTNMLGDEDHRVENERLEKKKELELSLSPKLTRKKCACV
ncbi:hypothetical protein QYE76_029456 [Lolium multiflorum]|uniref:CCHC-type domain-containing protein n=1 Tax=Lolium multiflorum TaxID=4521 RepID=A0AAD8QMW8_LOLMU|nr:hypothetical protein QYE76_029456 [Lolium multiflorum]